MFIYSWLVAAVAWGAAPALDWLSPAGGKVGSQFVLTTGGSAEPWPVKAWCDDPAVTMVAQTNKNKFDVTIGTNATPGIHLVRLWNADGTSTPRAFSIGLLPETEEKDPNNNFKQATNLLTLPITINGKFEKHNDNDTFALDLVAGKTFAAMMEAYRLGSMMDPVLHLFDASGRRVAFNHDFGTLDPYLAYTPTNSGRFYLQTMAFNHPASVNVNFYGNAAAVYRLQLSQEPFGSTVWPLAVQIGSTNLPALRGPNITNLVSTVIPLNSTERSPLPWGTEFWVEGTPSQTPIDFVYFQGFSNAVPVLLGEGIPVEEQEPNSVASEAFKVSFPVSVSGTISPEDRSDRFSFEVKKDQNLLFTLWSARLGSGLNCILRVEDEKGGELGRSSTQTEDRDPTMNWKAPRDGTFLVSVGELRAGKFQPGIYHLFIEEQKSTVAPTLDAHFIQLESGKTNDLPLKITRKNYDGKLLCIITNLPKDVLLITTELPEKGSGPLQIFVPATLTNWQGAAEISLTTTNHIRSKAIFNLQGEDGEHAGRWFIPETSRLWFSIGPKK